MDRTSRQRTSYRLTCRFTHQEVAKAPEQVNLFNAVARILTSSYEFTQTTEKTMIPKRQNNRRFYILSYNATLVCALLLAATAVHAQDKPAWPQFRGPESNPVGTHAKLAESWSKTENVEWFQDIPGRGWSSPIVTGDKVYVTTVTTDGKSKPPQTGTEYSNEYVAELRKQGLSMEEVIKRVTERDIELPNEVNLHYFLYCLNLKSGKVEWSKEFYTGRPPGGRHRKNSFISETPVTDGKFIYVYVANLGLWAFDLKANRPGPHQSRRIRCISISEPEVRPRSPGTCW